MMGIGFPELMVILVIIMIIFGAGKLPQIGSAFGQSIRNFKTSMKEAEGMDAEAESEDAVAPAQIAEAGGTEQQSQATSVTAESSPSAGIPQTPSAPQQKPKPVGNTAPAPSAKTQGGTTEKKATTVKGKKKTVPGEKSFEEDLIEQAIKELKDKRVGTIRTAHDGLVQQGDVFTKSVDKTPWHMKGRDKGVSRDLL